MTADKKLEEAIGTEGMKKLYPHGPITISNNHRTLREEVVRHRFATCRALMQMAKQKQWSPDHLAQVLSILEDTRP